MALSLRGKQVLAAKIISSLTQNSFLLFSVFVCNSMSSGELSNIENMLNQSRDESHNPTFEILDLIQPNDNNQGKRGTTSDLESKMKLVRTKVR